MRLLCSMLVLFAIASCASAQAPSAKSAGPNVTIIPKKWRVDIRNPALEKDPVQDMQERESAHRLRKEKERINEIRAERGMPSETTHVPEVRDAGRPITVTYVYEVKVSNTGEKVIRRLIWDYLFFEPGTEKEVGRRRFVSTVNISPGKTMDLVVRSAASPTGTIDARKAGKKSRDQYTEKTVIQFVQYDDGSIWRLPSK